MNLTYLSIKNSLKFRKVILSTCEFAKFLAKCELDELTSVENLKKPYFSLNAIEQQLLDIDAGKQLS